MVGLGYKKYQLTSCVGKIFRLKGIVVLIFSSVLAGSFRKGPFEEITILLNIMEGQGRRPSTNVLPC